MSTAPGTIETPVRARPDRLASSPRRRTTAHIRGLSSPFHPTGVMAALLLPDARRTSAEGVTGPLSAPRET